MSVELVNNMPVAIDERKSAPKGKIRIRVKKTIPELSIKRLPKKHRQALENLMKAGPPFTNEKKIEAAELAGFKDSHGNSLVTMDKILSRKPVLDEVEKIIQKRYEKTTDEKIAEVTVDGLEATHPLSKENKADFIARHKYVQELNKLKDNYPPKKIQEEKKVMHIHLTGEDIKQIRKAKEMRRLHESDPNPFR